jgi:hypothetical protein
VFVPAKHLQPHGELQECSTLFGFWLDLTLNACQGGTLELIFLGFSVTKQWEKVLLRWLQLDEDVYREMQDFRLALTKMFR